MSRLAITLVANVARFSNKIRHGYAGRNTNSYDIRLEVVENRNVFALVRVAQSEVIKQVSGRKHCGWDLLRLGIQALLANCHAHWPKPSWQRGVYDASPFPSCLDKCDCKILGVLTSLGVKDGNIYSKFLPRELRKFRLNCGSLFHANSSRLLSDKLLLSVSDACLHRIKAGLDSISITLFALFDFLSGQKLTPLHVCNYAGENPPNYCSYHDPQAKSKVPKVPGVSAREASYGSQENTSNEKAKCGNGAVGPKSPIEYVTPADALALGLVIGFVLGMAALYGLLLHIGLLVVEGVSP